MCLVFQGPNFNLVFRGFKVASLEQAPSTQGSRSENRRPRPSLLLIIAMQGRTTQ